MFRTKSNKQENDKNNFYIKNIESKRLDGKEQPINQYSIKYKEVGKKTKVIQAEWQDSITTAHRMLVSVNQELDDILKELNEIYEELTKNKKVSMNRPGFTRHFLAYKFRATRGCHECEAIYRGVSN